jgi:hypothetical protein
MCLIQYEIDVSDAKRKDGGCFVAPLPIRNGRPPVRPQDSSTAKPPPSSLPKYLWITINVDTHPLFYLPSMIIYWTG